MVVKPGQIHDRSYIRNYIKYSVVAVTSLSRLKRLDYYRELNTHFPLHQSFHCEKV